MKNVFLFFVLMLLIVSCENNDSSQSESNSLLDDKFKFETLTSSRIGFEKDGEFNLAVSNEKVLTLFREYAKRFFPEMSTVSFKIMDVENKKYLRFYGENNMVATIALIKDTDNYYSTGTTVCETVTSANNSGCLPEGLYCTKPIEVNGDAADCTRTTTMVTPSF